MRWALGTGRWALLAYLTGSLGPLVLKGSSRNNEKWPGRPLPLHFCILYFSEGLHDLVQPRGERGVRLENRGSVPRTAGPQMAILTTSLQHITAFVVVGATEEPAPADPNSDPRKAYLSWG